MHHVTVAKRRGCSQQVNQIRDLRCLSAMRDGGSRAVAPPSLARKRKAIGMSMRPSQTNLSSELFFFFLFVLFLRWLQPMARGVDEDQGTKLSNGAGKI